jgi:hypothetical protein
VSWQRDGAPAGGPSVCCAHHAAAWHLARCHRACLGIAPPVAAFHSTDDRRPVTAIVAPAHLPARPHACLPTWPARSTNKLMKRLEQLKREKQALANEVRDAPWPRPSPREDPSHCRRAPAPVAMRLLAPAGGVPALKPAP